MNSQDGAASEQSGAAGSSSQRLLVVNGASCMCKTKGRCFTAPPGPIQWFHGVSRSEADLRAFQPGRHEPVIFDEATAEMESEKVSASDNHAKHSNKTS